MACLRVEIMEFATRVLLNMQEVVYSRRVDVVQRMDGGNELRFNFTLS